MSHSNQVREYRMTPNGIELIDAYVGPEGVLTGIARTTQEARELAAAEQRRQDAARRLRDLARRREAVGRQIAELQAGLEIEAQEVLTLVGEDERREITLADDRRVVATRRGAAE